MCKTKNIDLSIIIPMYNVEDYISICIESTLKINGITIEIIIIDDGSTDNSYKIAKTFVTAYPNKVFLYHQKNARLAKVRNRALQLAKGEYILFLDSDDYLDPKFTFELYTLAIKTKSDMAMGRIKYEHSYQHIESPFNIVPISFVNHLMTGKDCFIQMMKNGFYIPMACSYIYKRYFLLESKIKFIDLIYEDEIWTLETLITAKSVVLYNIEFYHYKRRDNSITIGISKKNRIINLLEVANYLFNYSQRYTFNDEKELKSWIIIKILWLYSLAFQLIITIRKSSCIFPKNYISSVILYRKEMHVESVSIFDQYMDSIQKAQKEYELYTQSIFFRNKIDVAKNVILFYNCIWDELPPESLLSEIADDIIITTDRKYFDIAKAVIFHIPDLASELDGDLDKPEGQIWIAWFLESEENYSIVNNEKFMSLFDMKMSYRQDADIVFSYYNYDYKELLSNPRHSKTKQKKLCMLISSSFNKSKRLEYLKELMSYIDIDSYGKILNNSTLSNDTGRSSKLELYSEYKFVIAFENSIAKDYVTEKFYDPLIAGSVPVYLGAPNIEEFAPGDNCYIDVRKFNNPKDLASFIEKHDKDESLYNEFFSWKKNGIKEPLNKRILDTHPNLYTSAINKIEEKIKETKS